MKLLLLLPFIILLSPLNAFAQEKGSGTGFPIPRFVSLNKDQVFARTGPGQRYPIKWVYERDNLPVEVTKEFENWRKIRDHEGEEGWVHHTLLSGKRHGLLITRQAMPILRSDSDDARAVALIEPQVIMTIRSCDGTWCRVSVEGYRGFIQSDSLWGVYDDERIQ
jgi:SH3-like domain-containing protein